MTQKLDISFVKETATYADGWILASVTNSSSDVVCDRNTKFYLSPADGYAQPYLHYYYNTESIVFPYAQGYRLKLKVNSLSHDGNGYILVNCSNRHYLSKINVNGTSWPQILIKNAIIDSGDYQSFVWEDTIIEEVYDEYSFKCSIPSYAYTTITAETGKGLEFEYIYFISGTNYQTWQPIYVKSSEIGNVGNRKMNFLNNNILGTIFTNSTIIPISYPGISGGADNLELDYYDIAIDSDGDLKGIDSTDTSILMSLLTDKRANADEIVEASLRRGWFGDLFNDIANYQIGSKIWIHTNQARVDDEILQNVNDKAFDSLKWMLEDRIATDIKVNSYFENKVLYCNIKFIIDNNIIDRNFKLWEQSQWQ